MIEEIREKISAGQFEFSKHAVDQSIVRRFQGEEVAEMSADETMIERRVTYTLEHEGRFIIVENVPARVCVETGEQFFSPETVDRLQRMLWEGERPTKVIETPVYEFAA